MVLAQVSAANQTLVDSSRKGVDPQADRRHSGGVAGTLRRCRCLQIAAIN